MMRVRIIGVGVVFVALAGDLSAQGVASNAPSRSDEGAKLDEESLRRLMTPSWARGHDDEDTPCPANMDWANNQVMNILGRWWMPQLGDGAHMSTIHSSEEPNYGGDTFEGPMFYIPAGDDAGTLPLYRLVSVPFLDHMDSNSTNESGYSLEGPLGHSYSSQQPGTAVIQRWSRTAGYYDHVTARSGETPAGYNLDGPLGYGFPRSNVGEAQHCTENFAVQGGLVRMVFSKVAGGTVWELWWNGMQFVNDWEYGRQIQSAVFLEPGNCFNPTEGGDTLGDGVAQCDSLGPWAHGSPLISYQVQPTVGSGPMITTTTRPFQWNVKKFICPDPQEPCEVDHPVLWKGIIQKQVTLNYLNHPTWIRWDFSTTVPSDWLDQVGFTIAAGCFVDVFKELYAFNAETNVLSENKTPYILNHGADICLFSSEEHGEDLQPLFGGMIAATESHNFAIGVYHRSGDDFSNLGAFGLCAYVDPNGDGGQYGVNTYSWTVGNAVASVSHDTTYSYTVYLVVGTLDNVKQQMVLMKAAGL